MRRVRLDAIRRGSTPVLDACRLALPPGTMTGLVGRNGSGKSSILQALAGMLRSGRVLSWGSRGEPASIALVMQHPSFPAGVRARTVVRTHGLDEAELATAAPELFGTDLLARRADELSGGQRQRLALAMALARRDSLMLLDEPFANLDVQGRLALRNALASRRRSQPCLTIVVAAHSPADLHGACDSIIVLAHHRARQFPAAELAVGGDLHAFEQSLREAME